MLFLLAGDSVADGMKALKKPPNGSHMRWRRTAKPGLQPGVLKLA